ncbi:MAG TPA: hypothetical protein P5556_03925 [Candidatus Gastranaerophilales bacterium]|nr:hypothetical protein [Candidatus Gastranaerophilales bacterium]
MNAIVIEKSDIIKNRKAQVAEITKKHSQKLFGYAHATIKEIRNEAVRKRLDALLNF